MTKETQAMKKLPSSLNQTALAALAVAGIIITSAIASRFSGDLALRLSPQNGLEFVYKGSDQTSPLLAE